MVPLVPGSLVYLHQEQKNTCFDSKPTLLVRNLMRVFFKDEVFKKSNYGGGGARGYRQLNPTITAAIIGETTLYIKDVIRVRVILKLLATRGNFSTVTGQILKKPD